MTKTRINKIIFKEENIFLRFKTIAQNLTLNNKEASHSIEIIIDEQQLNIPITFMKLYKFPQSMQYQATLLKDEDALATEEEHSWGKLACLKTSKSTEPDLYYYLTPNDQSYAACFGPLPKSLEENHLKIDWENVQWGVHPSTD